MKGCIEVGRGVLSERSASIWLALYYHCASMAFVVSLIVGVCMFLVSDAEDTLWLL